MKGMILSNGILRAEDGNRYKFDMKEVENLNELSDLSGFEVDFELENSSSENSGFGGLSGLAPLKALLVAQR